MSILSILINITTLIIMPFIMLGIIKKTKAFWGGRKGVSLLQPLYDFIRLLKKEPNYSKTTSFIFKITPIISILTVIFAGMLVPMANGYSIIKMDFNFIFFAYILGLGKFFSLLSAMDTGSSFEGMGASREACFSTLVEPAFFIIIASLCAVAGIYSFENLNFFWQDKNILGICMAILAVISLLIMILIECSRVPVDDPNTHLELTMIHEVMILDNSGCDLALLTLASGMKMVLISSLISTILIPFSLPYYISYIAFISLLVVIAILIGTIESGIARFRMTHVFEFIFSMTILALIILALTSIRIYGD